MSKRCASAFSAARLIAVTVRSPFLLRSAAPPISAAQGRAVLDVRRLGKRIAIGLDGDLWLVLHLMIAGRLHWNTAAPKLGSRNLLAVFAFDHGFLWLTEAGTQRRAALHLVAGDAGLQALIRRRSRAAGDRSRRLHRPRCKPKIIRSSAPLTDPHIFSGIGNAYSDEILHRAELSPVAMSQKLDARSKSSACTRPPVRSLSNGSIVCAPTPPAPSRKRSPRFARRWRSTDVTASRVHDAVRRSSASATRATRPTIARRCQTGGRLLADRALSRLLHQDWPRTLDELDARKRGAPP